MTKYRIVVNGESKALSAPSWYGLEPTLSVDNPVADNGVTYVWSYDMDLDDVSTLAWYISASADAYCERYNQDCVAVRATDMVTDTVVYENCPGLRPWAFNPDYFHDVWEEEESVS